MTNHDTAGGELSPDELEQRQNVDGSYDEDAGADEDLDRPLTPDEIEQRQVVETDEDDAPVDDEG